MRADTQTTTYALVRDRLRDDILAGAYLPGARLTPTELADRYKTSSMPVRVALQELRGEGLVTIHPRRGAWVRAVDAEFISNAYDVRIVLLALIYSKCVRYITNADIEEIEGIQDRIDQATERGDLVGAWRDNRDFHFCIYRIARNPHAFDVMERTWVLISALRAKFGFGPGRLQDANRNHRQIIEALRRRDPTAAQTLAQASAERAKLDLIDLVARGDRRPATSADAAE